MAKAKAAPSSGSGKAKRAMRDDDDDEGSPSTAPAEATADTTAKAAAPKRGAKSRKVATDQPEAEAVNPPTKRARGKKAVTAEPDSSAPAPAPKRATRKRKAATTEEPQAAGGSTEGGEGEGAGEEKNGKGGKGKVSRQRPMKGLPTSTLPNPEGWRAEAIEKCLQCLKDCKECGTLGLKEKHDHNHAVIDAKDDLSNSIHWKGSRAGTRVKEGKKPGPQICYFARDTPCNGTNVTLVSLWVLRQYLTSGFNIWGKYQCAWIYITEFNMHIYFLLFLFHSFKSAYLLVSLQLVLVFFLGHLRFEDGESLESQIPVARSWLICIAFWGQRIVKPLPSSKKWSEHFCCFPSTEVGTFSTVALGCSLPKSSSSRKQVITKAVHHESNSSIIYRALGLSSSA